MIRAINERGLFGRIARNLFNQLEIDSPIFNVYLYLKEMKYYATAKASGSFSQHREDRFLIEYFKGKPGIYIDIGSSHPFIISNTYMLYKSGWWGITADPIPYLFRRHLKYRPRDIALNVALNSEIGQLTFFQMIPSVLSTFDGTKAQDLIRNGEILRSKNTIKVTTLAKLYQENLAGKKVNLLSVDAEGYDLEILKGNDWSSMHPELVICETDQGNSTKVDDYMNSVGYRIMKQLGCNRIYQRVV